MIIKLDGRDPQLAEAVYEMHRSLGSPVTALGKRFAVDFYYGLMVREGLVGCHVYLHEDQPVGFSAYTGNSNGMFSRGIAAGPFTLARALGLGLLQKPSRIKTMLAIARQFGNMDREPVYDIPAEMLSMVVLEEYRSAQFVKETGLRITNELFEATMNRLEAEGASGIKMFVDRGNLLAHVLYLRYGFKVEAETRQRGRDSLVYVKRFGPTVATR